MSKEGGDPFYSPQRESTRWGVGDPDMSGGAPDKSEKPLWNPVQIIEQVWSTKT
jgi:hypothetical protein